MTRKRAHRKGSRIDRSSTRILMAQKAPMIQRSTKPTRSRKTCADLPIEAFHTYFA